MSRPHGGDLVVLCPSRGRPGSAINLARTFLDTTEGISTLTFIVDADDATGPSYEEGMPKDSRIQIWGSKLAGGMVTVLNEKAVALASAHAAPFAIGFMGDDHRPRTQGWDQRYLQALAEMGTGIVHGDDLLQGENLATEVAMTANIIRTLGYMAPPDLQHMYVDNAWIALGLAIGRLRYLPDVVIEHMHPIAGKAEWDDGYRQVNDRSVYARDLAIYTMWRQNSLPAEAHRLRKLL